MADHHESMKAMESFVSENLSVLCAELLEWQESAILCDGKMRELGALCTYDQDHPLRQAERMVERAAIAALAQQAQAVDRNVESVRAKMLGRAAVGLAKYGVTTERGDLSHVDWLKHLQEELMDAAVYIEAALASSAPGGGGEGGNG